MSDRMSKERREEIRANCERDRGGYPGRLIPAADGVYLLDEVERLEAELARVREVARSLLDEVRRLRKRTPDYCGQCGERMESDGAWSSHEGAPNPFCGSDCFLKWRGAQ